MADIQSNIQINVDTSNAMQAIRSLQAQISAFHQQMQKSGSAANAAASSNMQRNLINSINSTKKFSASLTTVSTETESFTNALEKNKLSMGQYFRYAGASSRTFGRVFRNEFNTISKVAESRVRTLQTQYVKMGRDANGAMKAIKVRPLSLDMQNLSTQTMMAAQKQQIFNQVLKQGSTNLLNFGKNTQWAGRQLMVGFTVPLSIMGATAIKEFQKIEEQVIKLKRVYGDMFTTDAEVEKAVASVKTLADEFTKYGIAVESTIGLAASVAQMGNVGADMINQVTEATKLAVLGGMEQEKALDTTISLTNAFGIATEDLTEKINFLNAAENQTILAIDDFTEAVPKAGAVVSQLGGSVEDLAFFLTAMREGGVNASQAANALKSSLARLVNPTTQAREDLAKLGIDIVGIVEGNVGDLRGTIMSLGTALDELQPLQRSRALEELFGKFQFARMSTLFNNISREGSQAQEILRLTKSTSEELQVLANRELKRVEESPATKLQKQVEKLQAALAPIGSEFIKLITPLIEFLTDMLKKFNSMGDGAKSFVTGLITVLGLIAPAAIMAFGLVANGVANLMKSFNAYRSLLQILSGSNRDVTTQTQYMSQEQLEAASVAANLGQAHNYLAQQFTVEATALSRLTEIYRSATAEQLRYNAASTGTPARPLRPPINRNGGGRRATSPGGPVGYNKGTLNVPGPRGAGDIVPAILSPGEAVIPATQSQKYSGLLEAIMNDEIPGMFFGGIAGMLSRSRVATRMGSGTFVNSLRSGDMSYKSGFATGTGADFTDRLGRPMKQHQLMRRQAENSLYGTPIGSNDPSMRPTYGSVATSPMQRLLNLIFGGRKGRQFNQVTNPMASNLDQYGDISLIGKRSMNKKASTFVGDTLLKYSKNPAWVKGTAPMRGATQSQRQQAGFDTFNNPFGAVKDGKGGVTQNTAPQYIEAQTMGGFNYKEVDKIIARDPALRKQLRAELRNAGVRGVKVRGEGLASSLFKALGVPGFEEGVFSLPGPKGAGDSIPAMLAPGEAVIPAKKVAKYPGLVKSIIADSIPGFDGGVMLPSNYAADTGNVARRRASISTNVSRISAAGYSAEAQETVQELSDFGATVSQARQLMGHLLTATKEGPEVVSKWLASLKANTQAVSSGSQLVNNVKSETGIGVSKVTENFAHIGGGAEYVDKDGKKQVVKSELGMSGFSADTNRKLAREGASVDEFVESMDSAGLEKWNHSVEKGGGNAEELANDLAKLDQKIKEKIQTSGAEKVFDLESDAQAYGPGAVSVQSAYAESMSEMEDSKLAGVLGQAAATPREVRRDGASTNLPAGFDKGTAADQLFEAGRSEGIIAEDASDDAREYVKTLKNTVEAEGEDTFVTNQDRNSPHKQAAQDGRDDARAYQQGQEEVLKKKPRRATSPGGVPQPPGQGRFISPTRIVDPLGIPEANTENKKTAKGFVQKFGSKFKDAGVKFGQKAGQALESTSLVRGFATKLARAAGNTLVDSKGNVAYDADTDTAYDKQGNVVMGTAGSPSTEIATDPDGNPILDARGNPVTKKEAAKAAKKQKTMARRQKRGMVAGRLAGAMGTASMAAGMATMMPGVGDSPVMQQIQQFMPALFGLSAVLPLLAALPGPLALLVGAVGAVVAGMFMYNQELKKVQKEARDLGQSLTADQATMEGFAQAAGTATPSEIMDLRRQGISEQVQFAVGKTPFANQFFQGEAGTEMVSDFKTAKGKLGADAATGAVTRQLTTAISSGILSREQAAQIALELGNQLDDYSVTMAVTGEINQMFGPNGEDLINGEPLEIFIKTTEESSRAFTENVQAGLDSLQGGGGFFDKIFDFGPQQIASFTAGSLTGFIQEQQNAMDAFDVASEKRIDSLEAEKATAIEQGKDVSEINRKIAEERQKQDDQRIDALNLQKKTFLDVASTLDTDALNLSNQELLDSNYGDQIRNEARRIQREMGGSYAAAEQASIETFRQGLSNSGQFAGVLDQMVAGFKENLSDVYDNEDLVKAAENSLDELGKLDIDIPAKLLLGSAIGTGDIDPATMAQLLDLFELGGEGSTDKYFNIIGNVMLEGGPQAQAQVDAILGTIATFAENDQEQFEVTSKFLDSIAGLEDTDLTGLLDQLQFFSTFQGLLGADSLVKFMELSPADRKKIDGSIDKMQELVDSTPDEPLEVRQVLEQNIITDPAMIQAFKDDAEFFEQLDPLQQFLYIQRFIAIQATITEDEAQAYLASKGVQGELAGAAYNARNYSASQIQGAMADLAAEKTGATLDAEALGSAITGSDDPGSSGGGPAGSMLDSITERLRLFRDETVKATKGWTDSMSQIQALFGGTKTISIFDGLEQQLRSLGAGENLIELIAGMDPEEFEKRKNELFTIKNGQIVALKDAAVSIGDALNSIKIGEFQNQQEEALSAMQSQETAFQMLRNAGLDVADAYGVIADEALAAAIASGQLTDQEIDELVAKVEEVREQSDISDAFENARKAIEKFNDDIMIKANIRAYVDSSDFNAIKGTMINGQVDGALAAAAIMQDESLKALMAAGRAGSEEFVTRLTQLMGSAEFLQGVFDKGYSNVQEAFRVQEAKIRDDFETRLIDGTLASYDFNDMFGLEELSGMIGMSQDEIEELFQLKDPEGVVEQAKAQIATLEYQIDDFNAELDQIQRKEDDINEKYDERIDALDKVQSANDKVNRTQQSQLSVADALSRGDIAAAARAAQEARQQEAQARIEQRKQRVEEARERELSQVRSAEGNTREEIENRIKEIKQQILDIEEKQLEPATRAIELSQILLDKQIQYDTVLGKTREAWEDIKLEIDLAKIASEDFNNAIKAALGSVEALIEAYGRLGDAIAAAYSTQPSGGGGTAPTDDDDDDDDGGGGGSNGGSSGSSTSSGRQGTASPNNPENQKQHLSEEDFNYSLEKAQEKAAEDQEKREDKKAQDTVKATIPDKSPNQVVSSEKVNTTYNPGGSNNYRRVKVITPYGVVYKTVKVARGGMIGYNMGGAVARYAGGGMPTQASVGGAVAHFATGGSPLGTDTVPAMLTPGEFVIRRPAVQSIGKDRLEKMNKTGTYNDGSVYNYNLELNVKSNSNPDEIARTVITKIKQIDAQRIRGNKF